jgi:hypothetical protein
MVIMEKINLFLKRKKWAGGYSSVVECLPSIYEALGSTPSTAKKKKEKKRQ